MELILAYIVTAIDHFPRVYTIGGLDHWTGLLDSLKSFSELVPRQQKNQYHWCALIRMIVRLAKMAHGKAQSYSSHF